MAFENWPYANFHDLNLDWILKQLKAYGEDIEKIPDIIKQYIDNIVIDPATIATGNMIFVEKYGAKGDGTTNDLAAVNAAIDYCNAHGYTLAFEGGKTYYIDGIPHDLNCNVNGNGATLKMADESYFELTDPDDIDSMSIPDSSITNEQIFFPSLYGKSFFLETPFSLGLRSGSGTEAFYTQGVQLDRDGRIVNGDMHFASIPSGTYTATKIHNRYITPLTFENIHFNIELPGSPCKFLHVYRDNVTVQNIVMTGTSDTAGTGIHVIGCNNTFRNIFGYNPNTGNTWGYVLSVYRGDNLTFENVVIDRYSSSSWAGTQSEYCGNISVNNCIIPRFDIHTQTWGDIKINNSSMLYANIAGGCVNYRFENVRFTTLDNYPIYTRNDYKVPIIGSLSVHNCTGRLDYPFFCYNADRQTGADDYTTAFTLGLRIAFDLMKAMQPIKVLTSTLTTEPITVLIQNCELYERASADGVVRIDNRPMALVTFDACYFPAAAEIVTANDSPISECHINNCKFTANCYFQKCSQFFVNDGEAFPWQGRGACEIYLSNVTGTISGRANSTFYERLKAPYEVDVADWETAIDNARLLGIDITRTDRGQDDHILILIPRVDIGTTNRYFYGSAYQDSTHTYTAMVRAKTTEVDVYVNTDGTAIANTDYTWKVLSF